MDPPCNTSQKVRFQLRRGNADYWEAHYEAVLLAGEPGYNSTTNQIKIGDGQTPWQYLSYVNVAGTPGAVTTPTTLVVAKILTATAKVNTLITLQVAPSPSLIPDQIVLFSNAISATGSGTGSGNNLVIGTIYYIIGTPSPTTINVSLTRGGVAY